jgi:hypothetical protein
VLSSSQSGGSWLQASLDGPERFNQDFQRELMQTERDLLMGYTEAAA